MRTVNRLADKLLTRLVPQIQTDAATCVQGRTVWRTCYCSRGMRIGQPCYFIRDGDNLICGCFACQAVIGTC